MGLARGWQVGARLGDACMWLREQLVGLTGENGQGWRGLCVHRKARISVIVRGRQDL